MPKASPIQYAFNGGVLGPRMQGRSDLARYSTGCNVLRNFIPTYQGPALKRSGFRHVKPVKDLSKKTRLIPFEFSRQQAYMLELGEGYMRVYADGGAVLEGTVAITGVTAANPVVVTATNSYTAGDQVFITGSAQTELNGRFFTVANPTGANFELSGEDGTGRSTGSGGTAARVYEIEDGAGGVSLPWLEAELFAINYVQTADVLYLVHENHPPHKISRTGDTAWTAEEIAFDWPPFREENLDDSVTVVASTNTGSGITITGAGTGFTADMVGSYIKIREPVGMNVPKWATGQNLQNLDSRISGSGAATGDQVYWENQVYSAISPSTATGGDPPVHDRSADNPQSDKNISWNFYNRFAGYGEITARASDTSITVTTSVDFPYSVSTTNPSRTSHGGFAAIATPRFSIGAWNEEYGYPRAVAFYEDRLWFGGTTKDPQTLWASRTGDYENFEVVADEADSSLVFTLASDRVNPIEWLAGEDVLIIGTQGGEFTADAGSADQAITPSNIRVRRRSLYGTAEGVSPITVDSATLFVQRSGTRLHELTYTVDSLGYSRLTAPDLTQMSYEILSPGVVEMAYQAAPFRLLWCAISDGSLSSLTYIRDEDVIGWATHEVGGTAAKVESVATIPHPDGDQDQLWVITSRTVNGGTVRHIEYLEKPFPDDGALADAFFVDAGLTYDGSPTTTITGLDHLEGETVKVVGDGVEQADQTVSSGSITITSASKVHVGLELPEARLQTMRLEAGQADGTAMGRTKRIHQVVFRVDNVSGALKYGADFPTTDEWSSSPLYTGDTESLVMPGGWEQEGRVAVAHADPLPCTVVGIMPQLQTESI